MLGPGTQIGRYEVTRKLAEGGMAEIYLARAVGPEGFSKDVVIKVVRSFLATDPQFVQMFIAEARLASRLNHANVVQIFDFGKHEDTYYLAMEYVRGASLWDLRNRCRQEGIPFPATLAAEIATQIARGLQYAHSLSIKGQRLGVVHRDVTPHNVLLSFDGAVKLTDFGIAKATTTHTAPGMLKGKFAYMSPEQAQGQPVDARTDVFALGIVLWELLTGGRLFDGDSALAVLRAVEGSVIVPPARLNPDVPADLSDIVMKALARPLPERFQTAFELEKALATWVLRTAQSVEDTSVSMFLQSLYAAEAAGDERAGTPAHGAVAVARAAPADDEDFGSGDTRAVDRSQQHAAAAAPQATMTMTPVRESPRNATPRPRGVMDDDDDAPAARTEQFAPRKGTEQMPAYKPGSTPAPTRRNTEEMPAAQGAPPGGDLPRPKTEQYRPASRRLEPLVVVDPSVEPSKVEPRPAAEPAKKPPTASLSGPTASETEPAAEHELPDARPAPSRAPFVVVGAALVLGLVASVGYFATRTPSEEPPVQPSGQDGRPIPPEPNKTMTPPLPVVAVADAGPEKPAGPKEFAGSTGDDTGPGRDEDEADAGALAVETGGSGGSGGAGGADDGVTGTESAAGGGPGVTPGRGGGGGGPRPAAAKKGYLAVKAVPYAVLTGCGAKAEVEGFKKVVVDATTCEVTLFHPKKTKKLKVTVKPGQTVKVNFDVNEP